MPGSGADLDHVVAVTGLDDVRTPADVDVIVPAQAADDVVRAGRVEIVGAGGPDDRATLRAARAAAEAGAVVEAAEVAEAEAEVAVVADRAAAVPLRRM